MRELSATMTRTALSACADLVCKLTTARIGRSSYGRSSWRREILGHVPPGYVQRGKLFGRPETKSATQRRLFDQRASLSQCCCRYKPGGLGIARSCCNSVQSGAIGCMHEDDSRVEDWRQNAYLARIAAARVRESSSISFRIMAVVPFPYLCHSQ